MGLERVRGNEGQLRQMFSASSLKKSILLRPTERCRKRYAAYIIRLFRSFIIVAIRERT